MVYPWISEAFEIINPILPCSKNEAIAKLVEKMPQRAVDAALCYRSQSRFRAATLAIAHLVKSRLAVEGDTLSERKPQFKTIGHEFLNRLKKIGIVQESDTKFSKSSMQSYRLSLKTLGWIEVDGTEWRWIGPDDADWSAVTQENRRKKKP